VPAGRIARPSNWGSPDGSYLFRCELSLPSRAVVRFYNKRGTAEQWIKQGKQATHWTRLSCHLFWANEARLQLSLLAYNLGNLWRRLVLPKRIDA
jgi:Transposase DDE domain group 1